MSSEVYSYSFRRDVDMDQVKETLQLATMAAEGLHGRSRIQLDASFQCDLRARTAEVAVGTEVGNAIARIFTALLSTAIGERAFDVERVVKEGRCAISAGAA